MKHLRVMTLAVIICMLVTLLPTNIKAANTTFDPNTPAKEYSYNTLQDVYRYLDEHYIEKHPEAALDVLTYGSLADNAELQNLADAIAFGNETDREKADAVYEWLDRNITSNDLASPFPIDTLVTREGSCASYAYLMQDLLRKMGIPAVFGGGWSLPMEEYTIGEVVEKNANGFYVYAGHAWCFAYIDGEWVLYDVAYHTKGVHDPDILSDKYYVSNVDRVTPAYNYPEVPGGNAWVIYYNDTFWAVDEEAQISTSGVAENYNYYMENASFPYDPDVEHEQEYWYNISQGDIWPELEAGELLTGDHWFYQRTGASSQQSAVPYYYHLLYGGSRAYATNGAIRYIGNVPYFVDGQNSTDISPLTIEPAVRNGCLAIPLGYEGPIIAEVEEGNYVEDSISHSWKSDAQDVVSVNGNIISANNVGYAMVIYDVISKLYGHPIAGSSIWVLVYDPNEQVSYEDQVDHAHTYDIISREATCDMGGAIIKVCTQEGCADAYVTSSTKALGHIYDEYISDNNATKDVEGTKSAHCMREGCDKIDTQLDYGSFKGQSMSDTTTDKKIYQVDSALIPVSEPEWLRLELPDYNGIEIKVSDLRQLLAEGKGLVLDLAGEFDSSFIGYRIEKMIPDCQGETLIISMREVGTDILTEAQKATVEESDAGMLFEIEAVSGEQKISMDGWNVDVHFPFLSGDGSEYDYKVYLLSEDGVATLVKSNCQDGNGAKKWICAYELQTGTYLLAKNVPENMVVIPREPIEIDSNVIAVMVLALIVIGVVVLIIVGKKRKKKKKMKQAQMEG